MSLTDLSDLSYLSEEEEDDDELEFTFQDALAEAINFTKFPISTFIGNTTSDENTATYEDDDNLILEVFGFEKLTKIYQFIVQEYCKLRLNGSQDIVALLESQQESVSQYNRKKRIQSLILEMAEKNNQIPSSIYRSDATPTDETFLRIMVEFPNISFLDFLQQIDSIASKDFIFFFLKNIPLQFSEIIAKQVEEKCSISVDDFYIMQ